MRRLLNVLLVFLILTSAQAENGTEKITSYLLSTPVTLMDHGLDSMADVFARYILNNNKPYIINPVYRKDTNTFELNIINNQKASDQGLPACKTAISEVRALLGVDPNTGKPRIGDSSHFGAFFESYSSNNFGEKFRAELDQLVIIRGYFINGKGENITCEKPLVE